MDDEEFQMCRWYLNIAEVWSIADVGAQHVVKQAEVRPSLRKNNRLNYVHDCYRLARSKSQDFMSEPDIFSGSGSKHR